MFTKKQTVVIELSDELRQAMTALDNDMQVLEELTRDVIANQVKVLALLSSEITAQVPVAESESEDDGVQVFSGEAPTVAWGGLEITSGDPSLRSTPFTRAPRSVQVEWTKQVMSNGEWFSAYGIARSYATDERHLRYMKGALTGRLREMHEDKLVERRDSKTKGSMYEYRLKP